MSNDGAAPILKTPSAPQVARAPRTSTGTAGKAPTDNQHNGLVAMLVPALCQVGGAREQGFLDKHEVLACNAAFFAFFRFFWRTSTPHSNEVVVRAHGRLQLGGVEKKLHDDAIPLFRREGR